MIGTRRYRRNVNKINWQEREYEDEHRPYEEETEDMYYDDSVYSKSARKAPADRDEYNDEISCKMEYIPKSKTREDYDNDDEEDYKGIYYENGVFKLKMSVSDAYYGFIIGRSGEKKNSLERETQTTIKIPAKNRNNSNESLTVEGKSKVTGFVLN